MRRKFRVSQTLETTLDEAFEMFIEEKEAMNLAKPTLTNYELGYRLFYEYYEFDRDTLLSEISLPLFYKWINHMKNRELRPQTINSYLRSWRTFMNWCETRDMLQEPVKIKEIEVQEDLPKMYSDEEMTAMLEKPKPGESFSEWRTWAIVCTVYATGLRASTLCNLKLEDLNFQREELIISQQKNKKAGILPITPALANTLREYIKKWLYRSLPEDYLFPSITGEQLTVNALNLAVGRYCEHRGFKGHGVHSIRHNFARDMILNGAGEYRLQRYLQHSNLSMSQHYVKLFSADLKQNAAEFSPLDNAKKKAVRSSKFKKV